VKERHKENFERALRYIEEKAGEGISRKDLVSLLNDEGFKTRTGRPWTYPLLGTELKRMGIDPKRSRKGSIPRGKRDT
jgi:hypothetical protein